MTRSLHTLIQYLRHRLPDCAEAALTDAQLLERWINQRDPAAFELLLWRHGPMVLNTCRRLLPRREDVEDAFQATFLVLVRKAGSLRRREALAAWLHRVACRIAGRVRAVDIRRANREQPMAAEPSAPQVDAPTQRDLYAIVDEEIERLPAHYRRALILCCLEGKSQEEAARLLSCPRGTLSSWLTRGRERLRLRLLRRGIVVSTAGLTAALTPDTLASGGMVSRIGSLMAAAGAVAGGGVPTGFMSARSIALAEGVLRMMLMTKVKITAALSLAVVLMAAGVGTWSHTTRADDPAALNKEVEDNRKTTEALLWLSNSKRPQDAPKQDNIAWGEKAHGLQAGISFRRGDQENYEVGQSVTFVVYLRNVSDKEIRLSHIEPLFEEWMPVVEDAQGRHLAVAPGPINLGVVPIIHRSLEAGQRIVLGYPWFRIRALGWRGEVLGPTCCAKPGRYKVGYTSVAMRLDDGKDISLGMKQVELEIRSPERTREVPARRSLDPVTPELRRERLPTEKIGPVHLGDSSPQFYISSRSVGIPVNIDPAIRHKTVGLILRVSEDKGMSYKEVSTIPADGEAFHFDAPRDGIYWFIVEVLDTDGSWGRPKPVIQRSLRVCVDTTPPEVKLFQPQFKQNAFLLSWEAKDANLGKRPVTLEWAEQKDGPWHVIGEDHLPNTGSYTWDFSYTWKLLGSKPSECYLRIRVRDKAGNEACAAMDKPILIGRK
ncbi:MAG TPA: RNA polymerase sigma factor [Gemmataceae bacterium]|nr:RNA polymerase sigma factor [Gemmataceae bacterium]